MLKPCPHCDGESIEIAVQRRHAVIICIDCRREFEIQSHELLTLNNGLENHYYTIDHQTMKARITTLWNGKARNWRETL